MTVPAKDPVSTGDLADAPTQMLPPCECHAQTLLSLSRLTAEDVFGLVPFLQTESPRFPGEFSWASGAYVHGGIVGLRHNLSAHPLASQVFARFISSIYPQLEFTSLVILSNTMAPAHQDLNNHAGFPNALIPLNTFSQGGLWIEGSGDVPCPDGSYPAATGHVLSLREPILFDAHQLHATCPWQGDRCVLAAFVINDFHKLSSEHRRSLCQAEFQLPQLCTGDLKPSRCLQSRFPVVLEVFAGTARVTAALRRCGFEGSQGIDHVFVDGAACPVLLADLTTCVGQALALNWLSSPHVVGLFIAPPCGTCSRAREISLPATGAPCPAPLRTFEFPDGLPNLSGSNLVRVNKANQLYHFSSTLCAEAHRRGLVLAVENPRSSLFWATSFWKAAAHTCPMHTDFQHCAFGGRRPKWTRLHHNHPTFQSLHRLCPGANCAQHHLPWGRSADGSFATAQETAYPQPLASSIAGCFARAVTVLPEAEPSIAAIRATSGLQPKAAAMQPLVPEHRRVLVARGPNDAALPALRSRLEAPWSDARFRPAISVPVHSQLLRADNRGSEQIEVAWGTAWSPEEFVKEAIKAGHPKTFDTVLPSALKHSIEVNASTSPSERASLRAQWFAKWTKRAADLSADESALKAGLQPYARDILLPKRILLWREILEDLRYPDMGVLEEMLEGVRLTGQTPCTGIFPGAFKPAKRTPEKLRSEASETRKRILSEVRSQGHLDVPLEQKVDEEVELGWLSKAVDPKDVPTDATISRRFAIEQGGKIRLIDDLSDSGVNGSVQTTESPKPQSLDVVAAMVLACLRNLKGKSLVGKTFDLKSAYRQMFISPDSLNEAYIAYFSARERKVIVRQMLALPFGATRAVFSYLRVAHSMWFIGCWALKVIWTHFFDDFVSLASSIEAKAVDLAISTLFGLLGWKVSDSKDKPFAEGFSALGVWINFERFLKGEVLFHNTDKRIAEVASSLRRATEDPGLTQKDLSRIRGRMVFAGGQLFGRAGRLCVSALSGDGCPGKINLSDDAKRAMLQFADLLEAKWPRVVSDASADPLFIFTDASYSEGADETYCGIGGVCFDHNGVPLGFFSEKLSVTQKRLLGEGRAKTVIFEAELATIVVAFVLWKDWLRGRPAVFYIDNNSARDVSISGVSRNEVGKALASLLLTVESLAKTFSWFARVPSPANIADAPSRTVMSHLEVSGQNVRHFPCLHVLEEVLGILDKPKADNGG